MICMQNNYYWQLLKKVKANWLTQKNLKNITINNARLVLFIEIFYIRNFLPSHFVIVCIN